MAQICSLTKKLQLLERTNEIEEEERERFARNLSQRNDKFKQLKSQNDVLCAKSSTEVDLKQEAAQRKAMLLTFKDVVSEMPWMQPLVDLLENNQGNLIRN